MARRLTYEYVKYFIEVESDSGCKLISESYLGAHEKLEIECSCVNKRIFLKGYNNFKKGQRRCNECSLISSHEKQKYSYEQVKRYIEVESLSGCKLISKEYINNSSAINVECGCGETFITSLASFKRSNKKCKECNGINAYDYQKVKVIFESEGYSLISKRYKNIKTPMKAKCTKGHILTKSLASMLKYGDECSQCEFEKKERHFYQFMNEKTEYTVLGEYKGLSEKIFVNHIKCNNNYLIEPYLLLKGIRCGKCYVNYRNHEEFVSYIKEETNDEYQVIGAYKKSSERLLFFHRTCGNYFTKAPNSFQQGKRCECEKLIEVKDIKNNLLKIVKPRVSKEEVIRRIKDSTGEEYVLVGEYLGVNRKTIFKHTKCGNEYEAKPSNFFSGRRCPKCNPSKGEKRVIDFLLSRNIQMDEQKRFKECRNKLPLPFDIFVSGKLLIEYDGEQHFYLVNFKGIKKRNVQEKNEIVLKHDQIKNGYCIKNNIPLLRIPYWEFNNVESIMENTLIHFGLIESNPNYDNSKFLEYLVDENWNHDEYIAKCPKNIAEQDKSDSIAT